MVSTCVCRQRQSETTAGDRETHDRPPMQQVTNNNDKRVKCPERM